MKKLYFSIIGLALIGCGDGNVDIVKNTTMDFNKTMTIENALEYSKYCKSVKWKDTSKAGQNIVTATCKVKKEILKDEYEKGLAELNKQILDNKNLLDKEYNSLKQKLQGKCKGEEEFPNMNVYLELAKKHCDLKASNKGIYYTHLKCKKEIAEEFANLNCGGKYGIYTLESYLKPLAYYEDVIKYVELTKSLYKEIKSRDIEISFYVNTDKSVDVKDAYVINDEQRESLFSASSVLKEFYTRD